MALKSVSFDALDIDGCDWSALLSRGMTDALVRRFLASDETVAAFSYGQGDLSAIRRAVLGIAGKLDTKPADVTLAQYFETVQASLPLKVEVLTKPVTRTITRKTKNGKTIKTEMTRNVSQGFLRITKNEQ